MDRFIDSTFIHSFGGYGEFAAQPFTDAGLGARWRDSGP
jgi:hypothetical protein